MSKETFKDFVRKNPRLAKHVKNNTMSWQKFYELYDMYGEENNVWSEYIAEPVAAIVPVVAKGDFLNYFKNMNLDSIQESIGSLQRVLGVIEDLAIKKDGVSTTYEPKPVYKHLDD